MNGDMHLAHELTDTGTPTPDGPDSEVEATDMKAASLSSFPDLGSTLFNPRVTPTLYATTVWDEYPMEVESFQSNPPTPASNVTRNWGADNRAVQSCHLFFCLSTLLSNQQ